MQPFASAPRGGFQAFEGLNDLRPGMAKIGGLSPRSGPSSLPQAWLDHPSRMLVLAIIP